MRKILALDPRLGDLADMFVTSLAEAERLFDMPLMPDHYCSGHGDSCTYLVKPNPRSHLISLIGGLGTIVAISFKDDATVLAESRRQTAQLQAAGMIVNRLCNLFVPLTGAFQDRYGEEWESVFLNSPVYVGTGNDPAQWGLKRMMEQALLDWKKTAREYIDFHKNVALS